MMNPDLAAQGACVGHDVEMFYSERHADRDLARALCALCPIRVECLTDAIAEEQLNYHTWGMRGGVTARQRRTARNRARRSETAA